MNALLDDGDEVLVPAPDYPLWTAAVALSGGTPVHYLCDEAVRLAARHRRHPRARSRRARGPSSSSTRTTRPARCIPTSCCSEIVEIARQHQLIVFADEIYDKTLYDGDTHTSIASLADDVLFVTFNGLSKNYRSCGYRAGWMVVSGEKRHAQRLHRGPEHAGLDAAVRQHARAAGDPDRARRLPEHQRPGRAGRAPVPPARPGLRAADRRSRASACVKPKAALYMFPRLDPKMYPIADDQQFAYELLAEEKVLIVQGTGFNWPTPDHFRARLPAQRRRPDRGHRPHRALPRPLPQAPRALTCHDSEATSVDETHPGRPARHRHRRQRHLQRAAAQPGRNPAPRRPRHRDHDGRRPRHGARQGASSATACEVVDRCARGHRQPGRSTSSSS